MNIKTLINANKEVGVEAKAEKLSKCCCLVARMHGKIIT
jgi:hypothetical protein